MDYFKGEMNNVLKSLESELDHIQGLTKNLTEEIKEITKVRDEIGSAPHKLPEGRIFIDVGGKRYTSTFETLTSVPDSHIGRMFSGRYPLKVNDDGTVFIDRDGTHFGLILKFLRDPENAKIKMSDMDEWNEFKIEVDYYGLTKAMFGDIDTSIPEKLDWIDNKTIKVYSYSSQLGGFPATNTLDPNVTYWLSESGQTVNQWIVYEFPSVVYLNKIMMKVDSFECTAKDWMVQTTEGDDPKGEWVTVKQFQAQSGNTNYFEQNFEGFEARGKYIRLYFQNNWGPGGGSYILVTNIKFYGGVLEEN